MALDPIPTPHELAYKPLVEAILELRWKLRHAGPNLPPQDPGFRIALGRYYDAIRGDYPVVVDLPTSQVPEDMTAYAVRHQFRTGQDQWPLTQLGPGILTVNDTSGYTWDSFRPRALKAIEALFEAYPTDVHLFHPVGLRLRYINALEYDPEENDPIGFLEKHLHTKIDVEPRLFDGDVPSDGQRGLRLNLTFPLTRPKGVGSLGFANGNRDGKPCIMFEIVIRSDNDDVPSEPEEYAAWADSAHQVVDRWFFTLCRGELLESFGGRHASTNIQ